MNLLSFYTHDFHIMKRHPLLLLFLLVSPFFLRAQAPCGTTKILEYLEEYEPDFVERRAEIEKATTDYYIQMAEKDGSNQATITIPVVFHVLYKTAEQNIHDSLIYSQMDVLNEDYSGLNVDIANVPDYFEDVVGTANIEFCLASRDPNGNPTTGITRTETNRINFPNLDASGGFESFTPMHFTSEGGLDAWDTKQYLNIWVCNIATSSTLAWAYLPGADARVDGIVCRYDYVGRPSIAGEPYSLGRTMTHEVGHWLNLFHTFDNDGGNTCSQDYIADTPTQRAANFGCPSFPRSSCNNYSDMYMNYMDYTDDDCGIMFTKGQVKRMEAALATIRKGILSSIGCAAPANNDAQISDFISPTVDNCLFTDIPIFVEFGNKGNKPLTSLQIHYQIDGGATNIYEWTGELAPYQSEPVIAGFASLEPGLHQLVAYTSMPNGEMDANPVQDTLKRSFYVGDGVQAPYFEDFSELYTDNAWTIVDSDEAVPWHYITNVINSDSTINGAMAVNHYFHVFFDGVGSYDDLVSPNIDLRLMNDPYLVFDYSYHFNRTNEDELQIFVSKDCNQTQDLVYHKKGDSLSTRRFPVILEAEDWARDTVDLSAYAGESIILTFRTTSAGGAWLLLDNILVDGIPFASGISNMPSPSITMNVFPNPCNSNQPVWLHLESQQTSTGMLRLISINGQEVFLQPVSLNGSKQRLPISFKGIQSGLYLLELIDDTGNRMIEKINLTE